MSSILSVYWSPHHGRFQEDDPRSDYNYIRRLDPAWIRIHQPTATAIYHAQRAAPNAKILLRSWDIDDHNGDRKREMYADPKGAAQRHMALWDAKRQELKRELATNGWAYDESKWFVGLVNEPDPAFVPQVVEYSLEGIRIADMFGWHVVVVFSSVGNFSKPSENPNGWAKFMPLEKPINDGGHVLGVHEYWQPEGPSFGEDAGNLAWRHQHIPLNVPILIGESGANGYIYGRYSQNDDSGWQKTVKDPNVYAAQVREYIEGCDQRVQGVCIYMTDYHSDQWWSFDTQPAMEQLLAIKDARPQKPNPVTKQNTHIPIVHGGPTPVEKPIAKGTVAAHLLNIRGGADANAPVVGQLRQGDTLNIYEIRDLGTHAWYRIGNGEWVHSGWVQRTDEGAKPVQEAQPVTGIIDPKVAQAILKIESGGRTHGNDGRIIIRFEAHIFKTHLGNDTLWAQHFSVDSAKPWMNQQWRRDADSPIWAQIHTGDQANEWAVFDFARSIDVEAACKSISMGAAQILGSNHARIGYPSAKAMFDSFQSAAMQTLGFVNYCLSDAGLIDAIRRKDWRTVALKFNGSGQVDYYAGLLENAYKGG